MEKNFCKFLEKIGMIDKETSSAILKVYHTISNENRDINILELSYQILITFINNITNKQKIFMCRNIPLKYQEMKEKYKKDKIISILLKNKLKSKITLVKYLLIWRNKAKMIMKEKRETKKMKMINHYTNNSSSLKRSNHTSTSNSLYRLTNKNISSNLNNMDDKVNSFIEKDDFSYDNNVSKKSNSQMILFNTTKNSSNSGIKIQYNNVNNNNNYKKIDKSESLNVEKKSKNTKNEKKLNHFRTTNTNNNNNITKSEFLEKKELKECTFKPKINNLKKGMTPSIKSEKERKAKIQKTFDKLYYDNVKYKLAKEMKAIEVDHFINKEMTFNPNINFTSSLLREEKKGNFESRVKTFLEIKNKHSEKIQNKINKELNELYSFTPKINYNNLNINKSFSGVSKLTKTMNDKTESEIANTIPAYLRLYEESKMRNKRQIKRKKEIDDYILNLSNSLTKRISVVDYNKIKELYENNQKYIIREKTKNKVLNEEGVTFKPYIYKNQYAKNIYSTFYERNSKFLEDKEKFINLGRNSTYSNPKKKISKNEKKKIVKNIVDRLCKDSKFGTINNDLGNNK